MKVRAITLFPKVSSYSNTNFKMNFVNKNLNDTFLKQNSQITFTGVRKPKNKSNNDELKGPKIEKDITKSLKDVPLAGIPFLLGLAASAAMVKMGSGAKELLQNEDGYLVTASGVKSGLLDIDRESGIIEFAGTGISIDSTKCDIADWDKGIFKNYDGSIDIDLMHNKFIDVANGILVDPAEKISAVLDGNKLQSMAIPSFAGYQAWPYPVIQNQPFVEETIPDKIATFFKDIFGIDKMPETDGVKDIFGNDIIVAKDKDGDTYLAPHLKEVYNNPIFVRFAQITDKETATETINDIRLKQYVDKYYPSFGTRIMVYEGGRNAFGLPVNEIYNDGMVKSTLEKLKADSSYVPETGSDEAINFARFQNMMLKVRGWKKPKIDPELLIGKTTDLDDDGIPDFDRNGDGIIDYSKNGKPNGISKLKFLFGVMDKDGDGKLGKDEISDFLSSMDSNNDGKISLSEFFKYMKNLF